MGKYRSSRRGVAGRKRRHTSGIGKTDSSKVVAMRRRKSDERADRDDTNPEVQA